MQWTNDLTDDCACGRRKLKTCYVCDGCYRKHQRPTPLPHSSCPMADIVDGKGEFPAGAAFDASQFGLARTASRNEITTIALGYWPEGMIVSYRGKYRVLGAFGEPQRLEAINDTATVD